MLKKSQRLRTKEDFERVFRKGTPLFFGVLGCKMAKNDLGRLRLGFSFSKKHVDRAVSRNRLRRVVSAAFVASLAAGKVATPVDIVFFTVKKLSKRDILSVASQAQSVVEYINSNS